MNRYLKAGTRLAGAVVFLAGIATTLASLFLIVEAIPFWTNQRFGGRGGWILVEAAVGCGVISFFCFRYLFKLKKEERDGVQI